MPLQKDQKSTKLGSSSIVHPSTGNSGSSGTEEKNISIGPIRPITTPRHYSTTIDPEKWTTRRCSSMLNLEEAKSSAARKTLTTTIRRSISFDRIATSYLTGEWPSTGNFHNQLNLLHCPIILTTDKWTQTYEDVENDNCEMSGVIRCSNSKFSNSCATIGNTLKEARFLSNRMKIDSNYKEFLTCRSKSQSSSPPSLQSRAIPILKKRKLITPCQGSAEGFNQEVEILIHSKLKHNQEITKTPDGHRAPIAELLSMSSVNTQTLSDDSVYSDAEENHFIRIPEDVVLVKTNSPCLPIIPFTDDDDVQLKSSEMMIERRSDEPMTNVIISPNPVISKVYRKRQAPDGCEMDRKTFEDIQQGILCDLSSPVKTGGGSLAKYRIPSEHSAFCPLIKMYVSHKMLS